MIALKDILYKVTINAVVGSTSVNLNAIEFDSRNLKKGDVFVAIKGSVSDGHKFIDIAVKQGVVAVVCETMPDKLADGVTYVEEEKASRKADFRDQDITQLYARVLALLPTEVIQAEIANRVEEVNE